MKQQFRKSLAFFLALLMFLGGTAASASATPGDSINLNLPRRSVNLASQRSEQFSITVVTPPTDNTVVFDDQGDGWWSWGWPNYSGMVLEVSGGAFDEPVLVCYDEDIQWADRHPAEGRIIWDIEAFQLHSWREGENFVEIEMWAYRYTDFVPVTVVDGVEFGYFETEHLGWGWTSHIIIGVDNSEGPGGPAFDPVGAIPLPLNTPTASTVQSEDFNWNYELFRFEVTEENWYTFYSAGGHRTDTLFSQCGEELLLRNGFYLRAQLIDEHGNLLNWHNIGSDWANFRMQSYLGAGVYYLRVGFVGTGEYIVTVREEEGGGGWGGDTIELLNNRITVDRRAAINWDVIMPLIPPEVVNNAWGMWVMSVDGNVIRWGSYNVGGFRWHGAYAANLGSGWVDIEIEFHDGQHWNYGIARVYVNVRYSFAQWLMVIFLGGWIWMPYAIPGPFNLWANLYGLSYIGLGAALGQLFWDWLNAWIWR